MLRAGCSGLRRSGRRLRSGLCRSRGLRSGCSVLLRSGRSGLLRSQEVLLQAAQAVLQEARLLRSEVLCASRSALLCSGRLRSGLCRSGCRLCSGLRRSRGRQLLRSGCKVLQLM